MDTVAWLLIGVVAVAAFAFGVWWEWSGRRECPFCRVLIDRRARKCPHCHSHIKE